MFQTLHPLVIERSIHLLVSATKDGRMSVYVEPAKLNDNEEDAFVTPFRAQATPAELDAQLPAILAQWIASRQVAMEKRPFPTIAAIATLQVAWAPT